MRIPDSIIDDVRLASDIVDVISASVRLKKRGKNYLGLCPFHTEKTPSFNVSPEKQMFHCFGCAAGGNVFSFVMQTEKVTFPEAVRSLAERAGISIPTTGSDSTESPHDPLYNACRKASMHFCDNLYRSPEGKLALEYFQKRGFHEEIIKRFGLGCSLNSWDGLLRFAKQEGIEPSTLDRAGLVVKRDDGTGYYDRFRGRAMFPILSASGKTIGFGARKILDDDPVQGKYINSPETPIYEKSRVLYGLHHAKEAIRAGESVVLVEGYADLISLFQAGIENVVATSGTALTDDQIRLISRYTQNILLVYDADSAGSKAMMRGVDLIVGHGLDVRVANLPQGEDPDSFVRKEGAAAFRALLDGALSFLDFKVEQFQAAGLFRTPEGQTRTIRSIVQTIATMQDELKRNLYIKHLSDRHGIYETVLFRELERQLGTGGRGARAPASREQPTHPTTTVLPRESSGLPPAERDLLKVMVEHGPTMIAYILDQLPPADFSNDVAFRVLTFLRKHAEGQVWDPAGLLDATDDQLVKDVITNLLFNKYEISKGWKERDAAPEEVEPRLIADQCIRLKRQEALEKAISENKRMMEAAAARGEDRSPYVEKLRDLAKERHLLSKSPVG